MEFNGRISKIKNLIESPEFQDALGRVTNKGKLDPVEAGKKLREATFKGKTAREICEELAER